MPRWARFLSCSLTGLVLSLLGFTLAAATRERTPDFWRGFQEFLTTPEFRTLLWLFAAMAAIGLVGGRLLVKLWHLNASSAGLLAGSALALCYITFLVATQLPHWGGWAGAVARIWPDAIYMLLPFAIAGASANWLWERLE